jgi:hypothetical protein
VASHPESVIPLLLYDLPGVLTLHCKTYWQARHAVHLIDRPLDEAYHVHLPLLSSVPAGPPGPPEEGRNIVPEGQYVMSGMWLTALSDTLIRRSLKEEEYKAGVQRVMVREIIGRTVLGNVAKRIGEGWFWWALLLKFLPGPKAPRRGNPTSAVQRAISLAVGAWTSCVWAWGMIIWLSTMFTAAPHTQYGQTTSCWVELFREALNVDGRSGRRNWALRMVWAVLEGVMFLLSPLSDR